MLFKIYNKEIYWTLVLVWMASNFAIYESMCSDYVDGMSIVIRQITIIDLLTDWGRETHICVAN